MHRLAYACLRLSLLILQTNQETQYQQALVYAAVYVTVISITWSGMCWTLSPLVVVVARHCSSSTLLVGSASNDSIVNTTVAFQTAQDCFYTPCELGLK